MLTLRESNVLDFIKAYINKHGHSPTMAEIAKGIGIKSRGVVHRYVHTLEDHGLIKMVSKRWRNIQLVADKARNNCIPLLGTIAAGQPIEAIEQQDSIDISNIFVGEDCFALQVSGESMIDEGIFDGDIVVCKRSETASDGQIIVALIDNEEATLKRIQSNNESTVALIPANASMAPMIYEAERVKIQGIFIGLLRLTHGA